MRPSPCLMTGSRASLGSHGRRPRRPNAGNKRRRVESPDAEASDDAGEGETLLPGPGPGSGPVLAVGPFGTAHEDSDLDVHGQGHGQGYGGASTHQPLCAGSVCQDWWPRPLFWSLADEGVAASQRSSHGSSHGASPSSSGRGPGRPSPSPDSMAPSRRPSRPAPRPSSLRVPAESDADGGYSSQDSSASDQNDQREADWSRLPLELLAGIFKLLRLQDLGRCAQVCTGWRRATQQPCLWRTAEFVLGSSLRTESTPPALVNFILEEHAQHLKFVVLRTDSSAESARSACRILSRLVKCSLKTLALMSGAAQPSLLDVDEQQFASALTLVLDHSSPSLRALALDHTLVDDPSLQVLAGSPGSGSLQLLRCKSCPRLSPGGVLALVDHCRCLRELSISYTLLSDDLLNALSSERHVSLEVLRIDVYTTDAETVLRPISASSWRALVAHSPHLNLVMHLFAIQDECFDGLFTSYVPVTHLYFGDYVPKAVLGRVGAFCPRLVELVVGANGNSVIDKQLLDIAANCQQLSSLGLAECQVTCSALVRLAELCGPRLAELVVMEECLVEDGAHDLGSTCTRVSQILGRDWTPEFMPMW